MHRIFTLFDGPSSGFAKIVDVDIMMQSLGVGPEYLEAESLRSMKTAMDPRQTGSFDFETFAAFVGPCIPDAGSFEEQFRVFRMLDRGRKGYIDLADLRYVNETENGGMISNRDCENIMTMLRTTSRPGITFDEFKRNVTTMIALNS